MTGEENKPKEAQGTSMTFLGLQVSFVFQFSFLILTNKYFQILITDYNDDDDQGAQDDDKTG